MHHSHPTQLEQNSQTITVVQAMCSFVHLAEPGSKIVSFRALHGFVILFQDLFHVTITIFDESNRSLALGDLIISQVMPVGSSKS